MRNYSSSFRGKGSEFFGVVVINWLLTVITLGLYYPWAKERTLKYLYANTYLENDRFQFSGTGKDPGKLQRYLPPRPAARPDKVNLPISLRAFAV